MTVTPSLGRGGPISPLPKSPDNCKKNMDGLAKSCAKPQNEAGTNPANWHKIDTANSRSVPATPETQIAAQAGPLNGDKCKKQASAFEADCYHDDAPRAIRAGRWYVENRDACPRPVLAHLKRTFGLTALEVVQAIRFANGAAT